MRTPVRYFGGKANMVTRIISHFPQHLQYDEPFVGGADWERIDFDVVCKNAAGDGHIVESLWLSPNRGGG